MTLGEKYELRTFPIGRGGRDVDYRVSRLRKKWSWLPQPLKGHLISGGLTVSLKRYPDTKPEFFRKLRRGLPHLPHTKAIGKPHL